MTETSPVTFSGYSSDPLEVRHSTIGFPADHTEVEMQSKHFKLYSQFFPFFFIVVGKGESSERRGWNRSCQYARRTLDSRLFDYVDVLGRRRQDQRNHFTRSLVADRVIFFQWKILTFYQHFLKINIKRDIAVIDENGYGQIVGRAKDMLIRGGNHLLSTISSFISVFFFHCLLTFWIGENVYPREIEEILHTHPSVAEVHVSLYSFHVIWSSISLFILFRFENPKVIGVPDKRLGEEVCAWVRLRSNCVATEDELRSFCRDKVLFLS